MVWFCGLNRFLRSFPRDSHCCTVTCGFHLEPPWLLACCQWFNSTPFLVRTLADGDILVTTSSSDGSYVIETICTQCSCPTATNPGWRGHQSLESCAQTCAQEGSWIKHASGLKSNGSPGDNNCGCCSSLETIDQPADYGINVYQVSDATVTTSHAQSPSSYVIQVVCTQCSCLTASTPGWRGHQSLESCAQTCAREGSWFKHASGVKLDGSQGDNNCNCCDTVEVIFGDGWGVNVYELRDVDADYYFRVLCGPNCSCTESTKARTASRTFGDCAAFCAAEQFPRFQYDDTVNEGTCSCCISQGDSFPAFNMMTLSTKAPVLAASHKVTRDLVVVAFMPLTAPVSLTALVSLKQELAHRSAAIMVVPAFLRVSALR